jgi:hypothetical protein
LRKKSPMRANRVGRRLPTRAKTKPTPNAGRPGSPHSKKQTLLPSGLQNICFCASPDGTVHAFSLRLFGKRERVPSKLRK